MTSATLAHFEHEDISEQLFFHFDVSESFLDIETFIETAQQAQRIIEALDETFFDGRLNYRLIVLPPTARSFLTRLAVIAGGVAAVAAFLDTDIGNSYVKGLTGKEPAYWAEKL